MLNKIIKIFFAIIGAFTGFTLVFTLVNFDSLEVAFEIRLAVFVVASFAGALLLYVAVSKVLVVSTGLLDHLENFIHSMTLYELALSAVGLIAGLIIANLIAIPITRIDILGIPLSIMVNVLFGTLGFMIAVGKRNDHLMSVLKKKGGDEKHPVGVLQPKFLDTSAIIDGRIVDIIRGGFIEGELVVPSFVLDELRHVADSSDTLKRNRGRRGLDVLNMLQKDLQCPVKIETVEMSEGGEVDSELLTVAKKMNGVVVTVDYNLNKVASFQGVKVLNVNELANAVKPIALPGEELTVQVIKDGKENGQGIGYLEDGTMIVVEGGRKHMNEQVVVIVTSVLQTAAGRMVFAKPKYSIERVI